MLSFKVKLGVNQLKVIYQTEIENLQKQSNNSQDCNTNNF